MCLDVVNKMYWHFVYLAFLVQFLIESGWQGSLGKLVLL